MSKAEVLYKRAEEIRKKGKQETSEKTVKQNVEPVTSSSSAGKASALYQRANAIRQKSASPSTVSRIPVGSGISSRDDWYRVYQGRVGTQQAKYKKLKTLLDTMDDYDIADADKVKKDITDQLAEIEASPEYKNAAYSRKHAGKSSAQLSTLAKQATDPDEAAWLEYISKATMTDEDYKYLLARETEELSRLEEMFSKKQNTGSLLWNAIGKRDLAQQYGYESWKEAQNRYDVLKAETDQMGKELLYGYMGEEPDYDYFSALGGSIQNPTLEDAERWIGGKDIGNVVTYSRANADAIALGEANKSHMKGRSIYQYMTNQEVQNYNYLLAKEGDKSAQAYLDFLEADLQKRQADPWTESLQSIKDPVGKAVAQGAFGFAAGIDRAMSGYTPDQPTSAIQHASQNIQQGMSDVGRVFYSAAENVGNMTPSVLASSLLGGIGVAPKLAQAAGNITMGTSVAGNAYKQAIEDGYGETQAKTYGTLVGISETMLQKALGGISSLGGISDTQIMAKVANIDNALLRTAAKLGVNLAGEITEEELQNYLEPAFRTILFGEDYDAPTIEELIETALVTAITVGTMEGPVSIADTISEEVDKTASLRESAPDLVAKSRDLGGETAIADRVQGQIDSGEKVSGRDLRALVKSNNTAIATQAAAQAESMLTERGETENVAEVARVIGKMIAGQELSRSERRLFRESQNAAEVYDAMQTEDTAAETVATPVETTDQTKENPTEATRTAQDAQIPAPVEVEGTVQNIAPAAEFGKETAIEETTGQEIAETTQEEEADADELAPYADQYANPAAYRATFQASQDAAKYDVAYRAAYEMGLSGVPVAQMMRSNSVSYLEEGQRVDAFREGEQAAKFQAAQQDAALKTAEKRTGERKRGYVKAEGGVNIKTLTEKFNDSQRKAYRILDRIADVTGINIVLYESKVGDDGRFEGEQGRFQRYTPDTIYIDINAGLSGVSDVGDMAKYTMLATFSHEFTHFCEAWNPIRYNELRKLVFDTMESKNESAEDRIDKLMAGDKSLTREAASREVVAEALSEILPDANFVEQLATKHKSLFQKFLEQLKEFVEFIREIFSGMPRSKATAVLQEELEGTVRYMDSIVKLFDNVAVEAVERMQESKAVEGVEDTTEQKHRRTRRSAEEDRYDTEGVHWAIEEGFISKQDARAVWIAIDNGAKTGYNGYSKTVDGRIFVANKNRLMVVYPDLHTPVIETVYIIDSEYEDTIDEIRREIIHAAGNRSKIQKTYTLIEEAYGPGILDRYEIGDYSSYGWQNGRRKRDYSSLFAEEVREDDTQFQRRPVTTNRDAEYMEAVENGDKETAQRLVSQVAKQAGYGGPFYHGAKKGGGFTKFRDWSYFTQNKQYAERYTDRNKPESMYTVYVQMNNPFDTRKANAKREFQTIREEYGLSAIQASGLPDWTDGYDISEYIDENDLEYDSILLDEGGDLVDGKPVSRGISYVVRKSNQVKSADPVTYDDDGNVIPLSERFNEDNPDIRYQRRPTNRLSDREVLTIAAETISEVNWTPSEKSALEIFRKRLAEMEPLQEQIDEQESIAASLATRDPEEAQKAKNRAATLKGKLTRATTKLLEAENSVALRRILEKARRVAEKSELQAYRATRQESELAKRYKARIEKDVNELINWSQKPDTKNAMKHIPEGIKGPVMDFLETIDFSSKRKLAGGADTQKDIRLAAKLQAIKSALDGGSKSIVSKEYKNIILSDAFFERIENLINEVNNLTSQAKSMDAIVNEMSAKGLEDLSDLVKNLKKLITDFNTFHKNAMFAHVYEAGRETTDTLRSMKPMGMVANKYLDWDLARPAYVWERFGKGGESIWKELQQAQADQAYHIDEVSKWAEKTYSADEVKAWENDVRQIKLSDGKTVEMTVAQIMAVYKLREREQALGHLLGQGLRVPRTKGIKKADEGHLLTEADLDAITGELNDRQKAVADSLQKYMQDKGSEWGNQITMVRFGEKLFGEPHYYPIHIDNSENSQTLDAPLKGQELYALLNMGFTKQTKQNASNRIVIYSIFDEFSTHMANMATYNAYALPVVDAIKWFNYSEGTGQGVRSQLGRVYGRKKGEGTNEGASLAEAWILNQIKSINGTSQATMTGMERGINAFTSTYNRAQIAANLSVVIQQPFSVLRATNVISPVSLAAGEIKKWVDIKSVWAEMDKHSGIALWKKLGFYDVNITRGLSEMIKHDKKLTDKVADGTMKLAELMDRWAWATMWQACKREVEVKKGIKSGAESYWETVNDLFNEVIYKTQVVDSPLAKAEFMTSKSAATRPFTAFMSEPLTAFNGIANPFYQFRMTAAKKGKGAAWRKHKGAIMRGFAVYASSSVIQAMVTALRDAWRDDDEYAKLDEKWLENFWDNLPEELNPLSKIPGVSDAFNTVLLVLSENGVIDADVYENTTAAQSMVDLANKLRRQHTTDTKYTEYGKIYNWLKALSGATGFPFANLIREGVSMWNNTVGGLYPDKKIVSYDPGDEANIRKAYENGYLTEEEAIKALQEKKVKSSSGEDINYEAKVEFWKYKQENPKADPSYSNVETYVKKGVKASGVTLDTYLDFCAKRKAAKDKLQLLPDDEREDGDEKAAILEVIDSMKITSKQKDALYAAEGWSPKTIDEAPWH